MKDSGKRSKNIEVRTEKQNKAAQHGLKLQGDALTNESLKEPTPAKDWKDARSDLVKTLTNPGRRKSVPKRNPKDPKPAPFLKHSQKETKFK